MRLKEVIDVEGKKFILVPADKWLLDRLGQEQAILKRELRMKSLPKGKLVLAIVQQYLEEVDERDEDLVGGGEEWKYLE